MPPTWNAVLPSSSAGVYSCGAKNRDSRKFASTGEHGATGSACRLMLRWRYPARRSARSASRSSRSPPLLPLQPYALIRQLLDGHLQVRRPRRHRSPPSLPVTPLIQCMKRCARFCALSPVAVTKYTRLNQPPSCCHAVLRTLVPRHLLQRPEYFPLDEQPGLKPEASGLHAGACRGHPLRPARSPSRRSGGSEAPRMPAASGVLIAGLVPPRTASPHAGHSADRDVPTDGHAPHSSDHRDPGRARFAAATPVGARRSPRCRCAAPVARL